MVQKSLIMQEIQGNFRLDLKQMQVLFLKQKGSAN